MADAGQIHQVLMNLAVNAQDAMPRGGRLIIETTNIELDGSFATEHPEATPGPHVLLAVTDTGIGMDEQIRAHIFEPFFTTKEKGRGTGLGLATVYGIVRQSQGWIGVHSEPGQGATFKIYLPRIDACPVTEEDAKSILTTLRGSETVLVVEDQENVRGLVTKVLKTYGYRVLEAASGGEALRLAQGHPGSIHLMLTDVVMPGMGGTEVAERLKPIRSEMKVLYITGYAEDSIVHRGVLSPGVAFLSKPFTPEGLAAKVREVLGSPSLEGS